MRSKLRKRVYYALDPSAREGGLSPINRIVVAAILLGVAISVLETEPTLVEAHAGFFYFIDIVLVTLFSVEYLFRLWVCVERPAYSGAKGRLKYALSTESLIDLIAIVPFWVTVGVADTFWIRIARLFRLVALARLGRFSKAMRMIGISLRSRAYELGISAGLAIVLVLLSATGLYLAEGDVQPEAFGSIPRALWASIVTLTTVGYGDVYPITVIGKILAALTALAAIGIVAMPAGILAAAFSDAFQKDRDGTD